MRGTSDEVGAFDRRDLAAEPTAPLIAVRRPGLLRQLPYAVRAMRPTQWTKNGLVLLAVVFARKLTDVPTITRVVTAFGAFCLAASMIYIVNDITDREKDRLHPRKRLRPIASGRLSIQLATATAALCALGTCALSYYLVASELANVPDPPSFVQLGGTRLLFVATIGSYVVLNLAYSSWLKHLVLWDVFVIAAGFVLRALAGAFAAPVPISPWFYICTTFVALFLALAKRRAELVRLGQGAGSHRQNLSEYSLLLLDQLIAVVVTSTLITYSLYTFQQTDTGSPTTGHHYLVLTIPFVIFGVFRYLYLMYVKGEGERPDEILWRDPQILISVVLVLVVVVAVLYGIPYVRAHPLISGSSVLHLAHGDWGRVMLAPL
jgi:4-hydroxybenzoate polyprenyltransferase